MVTPTNAPRGPSIHCWNAAAAGDPAARAEILDAARAVAERCLRRTFGRLPHDDALDLHQDVAQSVLRLLSGTDGPHSHVRAYLRWHALATAKQFLLQRARARHHRVELDVDPPAREPGPEQVLLLQQQRRALLECIEALANQDQRHAWRDRLVFGMAAADTARRRGVSTDTVRSWISRGLRSMRARSTARLRELAPS